MFHFLFNLFSKKSEEARKTRNEKEKPITSASGYVYTDYKAKMQEAERKKKAAERH